MVRLQGGVGVQVEPEDKVQTLRDQVDGVKNIMTENVERILARGERLDDLMDKSEDLQAGVSQQNVHECLRLIPTSFFGPSSWPTQQTVEPMTSLNLFTLMC